MYELRLLCPEHCVEPVSDALEALEALSVTVEDADADDGRPLFGEPGMPAPRSGWQRNRVAALFAGEAAALDAQRLLAAQDFFAACQSLGVAALAEQDWVRLAQAQFVPLEITPGFWIVPTWHAVPAQAQRSIRLDPGLAFGTGTHPTTRMCLRWIARQAAGAPDAVDTEDGHNRFGRVLDYGCGSGILAMAVARFGAQDIDAVDIDPAAVQTTARNAQANGVLLRTGAPGIARGGYQTVLANILATPLRLLAPLLCARLAPGGQLVLAGVLERQADELMAAYARWLALQVSDSEDGWILLTARRAR